MSKISHERLLQLMTYDPLSGLFTNLTNRGKRAKAGSIPSGVDRCGYPQVTIDGHCYKQHALAWFYVHAAWPSVYIDHINGIVSDNRILNLREATSSENAQNRRVAQVGNKSGLLGVSYLRKQNRYLAQLTVDGKKVLNTQHKTAEDAHAAYLLAKQRHHPYQTLVRSKAPGESE